MATLISNCRVVALRRERGSDTLNAHGERVADPDSFEVVGASVDPDDPNGIYRAGVAALIEQRSDGGWGGSVSPLEGEVTLRPGDYLVAQWEGRQPVTLLVLAADLIVHPLVPELTHYVCDLATVVPGGVEPQSPWNRVAEEQ